METKVYGSITITDVSDAYSIELTNESHVFPGSVSSANESTVSTKIIAYKGSIAQTVEIISVNGVQASTSDADTGVAGLFFRCSSTSGEEPEITFKTTTSFVAPSCVIPIVFIVDGLEFTKTFSCSISFTGETGRGEINKTQLYYLSDSNKQSPEFPFDNNGRIQRGDEKGGWIDSFPDWNDDWEKKIPYIWTTTETEWSTGKWTYSPNPAEILDEFYVAERFAQSNGMSMSEWCVLKNITIIDGATIVTGSITADKMSVNDLSALKADIGGWKIKDDVIYSSYAGETTGMCSMHDDVYTEGLTIVDGIVTGYSGDDAFINIPETYDGKRVVAILDSAFEGNTDITKVIIPAYVESIGANAFCGCTALESVYIYDLVSTIGNSAFDGCINLSSVVFAKGSKLKTIGDRAFYGTKIKNFYIPDGVTSLGTMVFYNCSCLENIYIPDSVESAGYKVFSFDDGVESSQSFVIYVEHNKRPEGWDESWRGVCKAEWGRSGEAQVPFLIDGVAYNADNDMKWGYWVESAYNVGKRFAISDNKIKIKDANYFVIDNNLNDVSTTDEIVPYSHYYINDEEDLPPPLISIDQHTLTITDNTDLVESFYIIVNENDTRGPFSIGNLPSPTIDNTYGDKSITITYNYEYIDRVQKWRVYNLGGTMIREINCTGAVQVVELGSGVSCYVTVVDANGAESIASNTVTTK